MSRPKDVNSDKTRARNADEGTGARTRGEQTRQRIVDAALALFREHGYDETTMRAIAERAGVSSSNAYHYFDEKQDLLAVRADQLHAEYLLACRPVLEHERDLKTRLGGVLDAYWTTLQRFAPLAEQMFILGADPQSPLNPFGSHQSRRREVEIALFAEVVQGSRGTIHREIAPVLPTLLWLYHLGLQRLWLHDPTPNRERTRRLTETSVEKVVRVIELLRRPAFTPLRHEVVQLCAMMGIMDVAVMVSTGEGEDGTQPG